MPLDAAFEPLENHTTIVTITGPLTLGTSLKTLDHQLQTAIDAGTTSLLLDLHACPYADSAGLGLLMHTAGLLHEKAGALRLFAVPGRILDLLRMTRTDALLPVDPDRQASLAAL